MKRHQKSKKKEEIEKHTQDTETSMQALKSTKYIYNVIKIVLGNFLCRFALNIFYAFFSFYALFSKPKNQIYLFYIWVVIVIVYFLSFTCRGIGSSLVSQITNSISTGSNNNNKKKRCALLEIHVVAEQRIYICKFACVYVCVCVWMHMWSCFLCIITIIITTIITLKSR